MTNPTSSGSNPAREALAEAIYQEFRVGSWDNEPAWLKAKFYEVVDRLIPFFQSVAPKAPERPSADAELLEAVEAWQIHPAPVNAALVLKVVERWAQAEKGGA